MIGCFPGKTQQGKMISLLVGIIILLNGTSYSMPNIPRGFEAGHTNLRNYSDKDNVADFKENLVEDVQQQGDEREKTLQKEVTEKGEERDVIAVITKSVRDTFEFFYGVMIDAGSTGSRVHAFKFRRSTSGAHLEDALFKFNHYGLSSFAAEPTKGAESIRLLVDEAKAYIPESQWSRTPLALRATAGLRALPRGQSDALLQEVEKMFKSSQFKIRANAVSILDGDEEGLFGWVTLTYLMGTLGDMEKVTGAMDLGGMSTQITFVATSHPNQYVQEREILGKKLSMYTHSYLGLGLMGGRTRAVRGRQRSSGPLTSPCVAAGKTFPFEYQGEAFNVTGNNVPAASRYAECRKHTDSVVKSGKIDQPKEIHSVVFTVFSCYYYRAVDAHLIETCDETDFNSDINGSKCQNNSSSNGKIKVNDFIQAARNECEFPGGEAYLCLDLTYISSLLTTGFNFAEDSELLLRKKVDKFEVSWALGAMFDLLRDDVNMW